MEYRIFTKAGDLRWVNERAFIQRNKEGEITHLQGLVLDITERKDKEEASGNLLRCRNCSGL